MFFLSIVCAFLGLAFGAESMGLFAHEFNTAAAVVLLFCSALLHPRAPEPPGEADRRMFWAGLALAIAGLLLIPSQWTIRLFAGVLWFWGLGLVARGRGRRGHTAFTFAVGAMLFGVYQYLHGNSLLSWYVVQAVSSVTSGIGRVAVGGFTLGPTFSGIGLVVLAVGTLAAGTLFSERRRHDWKAILRFVVIPVIYLAYIIVFAQTQPDPQAPLRGGLDWWEKVQHALNPVYMPAVLACALSIPVAVFLSGLTFREAAPQPSNSRALAGAVMLMTVLGVAALVNLPAGPRPGKGEGGRLRFALYKEGFHNWMTPNKQRYGSRSAGMFGNLPVLLESMGWEGGMVPTIDAETLRTTDLLFLANPKDSLPTETIRRIERFVLDGGSLLVLGDHTWRKDDTTPGMILDEPLGLTDIRYRFDSAYYFIGGWLHSMQYWPHQTTIHLRDETNESGCVVGASLKIGYPATPLVVGRYGYADKGHEQKDPRRGYMDNGLPDPGEILGDLVLVAAQNVGRGRVVVVGDTSGFVNAIQTQTWRFTSRVFGWLGSSGRATVPWWREALGVILLLGACGAVVVRVSAQPSLVPIMSASLLVAGWAAHRIIDAAADPEPLRGNVALVDLSHVGLHSLEAWRDDAISGIYLNLMREGYFAIGSKAFDEDQIRASDLVFSVAPSKPYSGGELDALEAYMRDGGSVVLMVGWEEKAGAQTLLRRFHLDIAHRPQGRAAEPIPGANVMPNYWEAWPVVSTDPVRHPIETLASLRGDPIMVRKRIGRGQLIVIGDSKFMFCKNLETEDGAIMPNVQVFRWLVERVFGQEVS